MVKYSIKTKKKEHRKKEKKILMKKNIRKDFHFDYILIDSKKSFNMININEKINENSNNSIQILKDEHILIESNSVLKEIKEDKLIKKEKNKKKQNNIKLIKYENIDNDDDNYNKNNILINNINPVNIKNYKPKGLENFNCNCYMNSLLQCLFYLKEFRQFFLDNKFEKEQLICQAMKDVVIGLNTQDGKNYYSPRRMKNEIKKDIIFKDGEGSDVTDLLDFIFAGIISELDKDSSSMHTVEYQNLTQDKRLVYREAYNEINFQIIINKLFVGFYEKEFIRNNNIFKYSFQSEYRIVFSLEEIFSYYKGKKVLTLYDCFDHYKRVQNIDDIESKSHEDDKSISFDDCIKKSSFDESEEESESNQDKEELETKDKSQKCEGKYTLIEKIFRTPKYLILILDRGYKKKCDKTVFFDEEIDLSDYIDDNTYEYQTKYKLVGVCIHHGRSGNSGHYTSICLCDDNKYYHLNDSHSSCLKDKNEFYKGSPYILFYSRFDLTEKQKAIKLCHNQLKSKIKNVIIKMERMNKYEIEKIYELYLMKYIIKEKKFNTLNETTIEIDFSELKHNSLNPKLKIKRLFKAKKKEKKEEENIYWDDNLSNKENEEIFEKAIESYFKDFENKNKKSIICYLF